MSVSYTYNDDGLRTGFALDPQLRCGVGRVRAAALRPGRRRRKSAGAAGKTRPPSSPAAGRTRTQKLVWNGEEDTSPDAWYRYESEGLNELRMDERYDSQEDGNAVLDANDPWRTIRYTIHGPGMISHEIKETKHTYFGAGAEPVWSTTFYYHFDALGNVLGLSDSDGALLETYRLDAFGVDQNDWTQDAYTTRRITGKEYDRDVGFYDFYARQYDPVVGRFVAGEGRNVLPCGTLAHHRPGQPLSYAMARNNPLIFVDPDGQRATTNRWTEQRQFSCAFLAKCPDGSIPPPTVTLTVHVFARGGIVVHENANGVVVPEPGELPSPSWIAMLSTACCTSGKCPPTPGAPGGPQSNPPAPPPPAPPGPVPGPPPTKCDCDKLNLRPDCCHADACGRVGGENSCWWCCLQACGDPINNPAGVDLCWAPCMSICVSTGGEPGTPFD